MRDNGDWSLRGDGASGKSRGLAGEEVLWPIFVLGGLVGIGAGERNGAVGDRGSGVFPLGDGGGVDGLRADYGDSAVRLQLQSGDFYVLLIGFSLVDFAIEADVGVEEGLGSDILEDVNLVRAVQKDVRSAVGDDAAEAVGAFDDAGFGIGNPEVELGAVRKSVGEDRDLARAAAAGLAGRDADGFLEKRAPLGDFDIHRLGGEGLAE